jgi:antitoxin MazE
VLDAAGKGLASTRCSRPARARLPRLGYSGHDRNDNASRRPSPSLQKWGNGLGLRIPKSLAAEAKVGDGSSVELSLQKGALLVSPERHRYSLHELLVRVARRDVHREVDSGAPRGREAW